MQEKKALSSRGRGRLRGFLELRRPWAFWGWGKASKDHSVQSKSSTYQALFCGDLLCFLHRIYMSLSYYHL